MKLLLFILLSFVCASPAFGQDSDSAPVATDVEVFQHKARYFSHTKQYNLALERINKAIEIEPYNPESYLIRSGINAGMNDDNAALADVRAAIYLQPDNLELLKKAALQLSRNGQYEESVPLADKLIAGGNPALALEGAEIRYLAKFEFHDYTATIEYILKNRDVISAITNDRKLVVDFFGHLEGSESLLSLTLKGLRDDPRVFYYYGELFKYLKERQHSGFTSTGMMSLVYHLELTLYSNYALLLEEKGMSRESAALAAQMEKEFGLFTRAEIYKRMKRYDAAIRDISKVLQKEPDKAGSLSYRGDLYALDNQPENALADYQAALAVCEKDIQTPNEQLISDITDKIKILRKRQRNGAEQVK